MRHFGWNVHDIARSKLLDRSALNRRTSYFVRLDGFGFDHGSTYHERGFASLDDHDVGLSFVKFGAAVAFAMRNSHQVVLISGKRLPGEPLIINFARELLPGILDRIALPETKAFWIGGADPGRGGKQYNDDGKHFHSDLSKQEVRQKYCNDLIILSVEGA